MWWESLIFITILFHSFARLATVKQGRVFVMEQVFLYYIEKLKMMLMPCT